jgi:poly(A) polymerase
VLARILPGADARFIPVLVHAEDTAPRWQRRLAVLGGDRTGLRLSKLEARELQAVIDALGTTQTIAALAWLHGADVATDAALARAAMFETTPAPDWRDRISHGASAKFPITSQDLAPLEGPALGQRLKALQARWLQSDLSLTREDLLR